MNAKAVFREDMAVADVQTRILADLKAAAVAGDSAKALQLLQSVESQQIPKTTVMYNRALKALAASNQHDKFQETLEAMEQSGVSWDPVTVKMLVTTYSAKGDFGAAIEAFERAREDDIVGVAEASLYDAVIGAYRKTGAFDKALDLCDEMRALRMDPTKEGYAFIATVAIRDKKTYLISRTLDTMKQEGFAAEDIEYVREVIVSELPEELKYQADGVHLQA